MDGKMNILGLNIDTLKLEEVLAKTKEFLQDDVLNTIFIVTAETLIEAESNEEFKQLIETADILLPGDKLMLDASIEETEVEEVILNYEFVLNLLDSIALEKRTMFILGKSEKEVKFFEEYLFKVYPNIECVGAFGGDVLAKQEHVINDINAIAPDIILVAIETPRQETWITSNKNKLNSKLCIGVGNVINIIAKSTDIEVENGLKPDNILSLGNIGNSLKNIAVSRIFKKKLEQYKNKKGEED